MTEVQNKMYMEEKKGEICLFQEFPEEKKKSNLISPRNHNAIFNYEF